VLGDLHNECAESQGWSRPWPPMTTGDLWQGNQNRGSRSFRASTRSPAKPSSLAEHLLLVLLQEPARGNARCRADAVVHLRRVRGLCIEVIEPELAEVELFRLMRANEESGVADDPALLELARRASTEELAHYVQRGRKGVERNRAALQAIERKLAGWDSKLPLDHNQGSIGGRAAMRQKEKRAAAI
jgi:hypothetical protein